MQLDAEHSPANGGSVHGDFNPPSVHIPQGLGHGTWTASQGNGAIVVHGERFWAVLYNPLILVGLWVFKSIELVFFF